MLTALERSVYKQDDASLRQHGLLVAQLTAESPYTLQLAAPSPSKLHLAIGILTLSNTWFLVPIRVHSPNGISIGSDVLQAHDCDRQTNRPRSIGNNRPHLRT